MKIFHIKSSDCTSAEKQRFVDIVCAFASIGINQQILMNADEYLESLFIDRDIPCHIQKFSGLFDLRTQQAAQQIAESFGPHIIQTHSPDSALTISKLNHEALRIGFMHEDAEQQKKIEAITNLMLKIEYTTFGSPLDYNVLSVPPLIADPGPDVIPATKEQFGTPEDKKVIGIKGDLTHAPDIRNIILSIKEIPNAHLWVIEPGPCKEGLENIAHRQAVQDKICFIDESDNDPGIIKACDLCVMPELKSGIDRLTLEAWACNVPVLSAMPEENSPISDDIDGWLIRKPTPPQWSKKINDILADNDARIKIAKAGYDHYHRSYTEKSIVSRYLQCYETGLRIAV